MSTSHSFYARAPGSLMLIGEHAVLRGGVGIAVAINQWMHVTLTPRSDKIVSIESSLGAQKTDIFTLKLDPPFQFVLAALQLFQKEFHTGFHLKIESDFSPTVGFGSSAAVTVATILVCQKYLSHRVDKLTIFELAKKAMLAVQKIGSGTDVAASVFGGIVAYEMKQNKIEEINCALPITAVYSGNKKPTVEVLQFVEKAYAQNPEPYEITFSEMKKIALAAKTALQKNNLSDLSLYFKAYQKQMVALGVSNAVLNQLVMELEKDPEILAAKISGSGLGDCVIGIGNLSKPIEGFQQWSLVNAK